MARKKNTIETPVAEQPPVETEAPAMRRCIGSARFGIEAHDAPVGEFPRQPSQRDGIGRMCAVHWRQYTTGLAREAKARKMEAGDPALRDQPPTAEEVVSA